MDGELVIDIPSESAWSRRAVTFLSRESIYHRFAVLRRDKGGCRAPSDRIENPIELPVGCGLYHDSDWKSRVKGHGHCIATGNSGERD